MRKGLLKETLESLAPPQEDIPTWEGVLYRAGIETSALDRRQLRKRYLIAITALIAMLVPLAAIGSQSNWWFLSDGSPQPVSDIMAVTSGTWDGYKWQLVAFRSDRMGLCYAMQSTKHGLPGPKDGGGEACGEFDGVPLRPSSKPSRSVTIAALSGSLGPLTKDSPYVVGPVVDQAARVDVYLQGGRVIHAPTLDAPDELNLPVRFFVAQLPPAETSFSKLVAIDGAGNVVACLPTCK